MSTPYLSLSSAVREAGIQQRSKDAFDLWKNRGANSNIAPREVHLPSGHTISWPQFSLEKPVYYIAEDGVQKKRNLTPMQARNLRISYSGEAYVTTRITKGAEFAEMRMCIGKIPIMIGTECCHTYGLSRGQLRKIGEDQDDFGGYFIVGGLEKSFIHQEHLTLNRIAMMPVKGVPHAKMTIQTLYGTSLFELAPSKKNGTIKAVFGKLNKKSKKCKKAKINVIRVFRLMGISDISRIRAMVGQYIAEDIRSVCLEALEPSIDQVLSLDNLVSDVEAVKKHMPDFPAGASLAEMERLALHYLEQDMFPHIMNSPATNGLTVIEDQNRRRKSYLETLALMVSHFVRFKTGHRKYDDRNSWSNKRATGPARMMEKMLRSIWRSTITEIEKTIKADTLSEGVIMSLIRNILYSSSVTSDFESAFISGNWSTRGSKAAHGVVLNYERMNIFNGVSNLASISVAVSPTSSSLDPRKVDAAGKGFIDFVFCTDDEKAGMAKRMACTASPSLVIDPTVINAFIKKLRKSEGYDRLFRSYDEIRRWYADDWEEIKSEVVFVTFNGVTVGTTFGEEARATFVAARRSGAIDAEASFVIENGWLNIDIAPSRMVRPLLIVNTETQELVIDELVAAGTIRNAKSAAWSIAKGLPNEAPYVELLADLNEIAYEPRVDGFKGALAELIDRHQGNSSEEVQAVLDELRSVANDERLASREYTLRELMDIGAVEKISAWEQEYSKVAAMPRDIIARRQKIENARLAYEFERTPEAKIKYERVAASMPYTHMDISPLCLLGPVSACVPFANFNQAPRNTFQTKMKEQLEATPHANYRNRFVGMLKLMCSPQTPLVQTYMDNIWGEPDHGSGINIVVADICDPHTQEDAFTLNKAAFERGCGRMEKHSSYTRALVIGDGQSIGYPKLSANDNPDRYHALDPETGYPMIGAAVNPNDAILGRMLTVDGLTRNTSVYVKVGDQGVVDDLAIAQSGKNTLVIIKLRITRQPQIADKFAPRYAQKGTGGNMAKEHLLFYTRQGIRPTLIFNAHSMPSRMTIGYKHEMTLSKVAAFTGKFIDGSAFQDVNLEHIHSVLHRRGYEGPKTLTGKEEVFSGMTGKKLPYKVFIGPVSFQVLKHMVDDKIQARNRGRYVPQTRQPNKGKSIQGGIRFGEMERDVLITHGAAGVIQERLMGVSDAYETVFCLECGQFAVNDEKKGFTCPLCNSSSFGRTTIPYAYKLLIHIAGGMGFNLRPCFDAKRAGLKPSKTTSDDEEIFEDADEELFEEDSDAEGDPFEGGDDAAFQLDEDDVDFDQAMADFDDDE